jgi:hypothetical protein
MLVLVMPIVWGPLRYGSQRIQSSHSIVTLFHLRSLHHEGRRSNKEEYYDEVMSQLLLLLLLKSAARFSSRSLTVSYGS